MTKKNVQCYFSCLLYFNVKNVSFDKQKKKNPLQNIPLSLCSQLESLSNMKSFISITISLIVFLLKSNILNGLCDSTCDVCLINNNFESGTYRIIESGKYCLDEDIEFNPNQGTIDSPNSEFNWWPLDPLLYPGSDTFVDGAYALGFFAAITIETNDVEIDLCGQQIGQHLHHYLQQRFFSVIEIAISPFLSGVGPTTFGSISNTSNIYIHNGIIGLSSHQGIHSNEANNVIIENLIIRDFEVAGIQMNGFTGVQIKDVTIGPSATNVQRMLFIMDILFSYFVFFFFNFF